MDTRIDIIAHSPAALAIRALEKSGYQAWIVGGWVRDTLMGRMPHDADIATNAPWEHTKRIMRGAGYAVHETGVKHGTVTAIVSGEPIEITTYRIEGPYSDSRHPDYVEFVDSIELDLARRDFTMNAIAFHPTRGIFDPFDGASDIEARTIRAVGDARKRFEEDPLRILRAARFEAQTGFEIEPATRDAAFSCAHLLDSVARERTGSELTKLLCGPYAGRVIENEFPIVVQAINELEVARGFKLKSKRHAYDLLGHLAHSVSAAPENEALRWAALLHDIAKPESNHDHAQRSSIAATRIMQRLRIGRQQTQQAADAIAWHMTSLPPSEEALRLFVACLGGDVPRGHSCSSEPTRVDTAQRETRAKKRSMKNSPCSMRSNAAESRSARNSSHCRAKRLQTWEIFMVRKSAEPSMLCLPQSSKARSKTPPRRCVLT